MRGGENPPFCWEIGYHFSQEPCRDLKILDFFKNDIGPRVEESFWAYLECLSRKQTGFDKNLHIFEAKIINFIFSKNLMNKNFNFSSNSELLIVWEFFWGAACHSSSKIDESRIFRYDFLWFFSLCHQSLCEVAEAKLLGWKTS